MSIFADLGIKEGNNRIKEEVLYNMAMCYTLVERHITEVLAPYNLSPVKINALLIIKHVGKKEGIPQVNLSKRMIVTAGNITRLLERLESAHLIKRVSHKNDKRVKLIVITKKASDLLNKVWPVYKHKVDSLVSLMPSVDIVTAGIVLSGFREKLSLKNDY